MRDGRRKSTRAELSIGEGSDASLFDHVHSSVQKREIVLNATDAELKRGCCIFLLIKK